MNETMKIQTTRVRRSVTATILALSIALGMSAAPVDAGGPNTAKSALVDSPAVVPIELSAGRTGPVLPGGRLSVDVAIEAFGDDRLTAALDAGARIDSIGVGEPTPTAASPYHDSTTWHWEICITIWTPSGLTYTKCIGLTIRISTDVNNSKPTGVPVVLTAATAVDPFEICFETTDKYGNVITRCFEITIETSDDDEAEARGVSPTAIAGF